MSFFYGVLVYCRNLFLLKIPITKVIPMQKVMSENYYGQKLYMVSVYLVVFQASGNHRNSSILEI